MNQKREWGRGGGGVLGGRLGKSVGWGGGGGGGGGAGCRMIYFFRFTFRFCVICI